MPFMVREQKMSAFKYTSQSLALSILATLIYSSQATAQRPPVLPGFTLNDGVATDDPGDDALISESDLFKVRTSGDEKLKARTEVVYLTEKIGNCRERSLHIPGLDMMSLPKDKRESLEMSLNAIRSRQLASLLNRRGTFLAILGNQNNALRDLDEAVDFDSEYAPAYNNRAWLRAQQGELSGALSDVNKALSLAPKMEEAYDTRGTINLAQKRLNEALNDFNTSIDLNDKYAEAYYHRAIAHKLLGDIASYKADENIAKQLETLQSSK